ncbi:CHASE2 domain-containing protein [Oceanispirochaeta crateris]|uniref:CHASE2 domain-containing protein n=1 Tax=Oceanispirochaeta crateris TaxID=2518645 RepID=A0A5C1QJB1_9SPIO|nr:adenylate/guanylate cyclase domain-containing protein [Oceanispirochaeta crateris]QEN07567.1 CHASE2 domain-containing protein [Oceanispirochaeta crateris]
MEGKNRGKILNVKYFSLVLGFLFFLLFWGLTASTSIFDHMEHKLLDLHFNLKTVFEQTRIQEGVTIEKRNPQISPDILILGIDFNSLNAFGRWPFERYRHANLLDAFSRIQDQSQRESALFLDIFFIEPDNNAYDDVILTEAIQENGRVFIETVLKRTPMSENEAEEFFARQQILYDKYGEIHNIQGDTSRVIEYYGLQSPLKPYGRAAYGYGHANFYDDYDKKYRRQQLIAKSSVVLKTLDVDELSSSYSIDLENQERLAWVDKDGQFQTIEYPLTDKILNQLKKDVQENSAPRIEDSDNDGNPDKSYYVVYHLEDHFIPSITLSLAVHYFNKSLSDLEVVIGDHITIHDVEYFNSDSAQWEPYVITDEFPEIDAEGNIISEGKSRIVRDITIPIDDRGQMLINYMGTRSNSSRGGYQTFPVRSYSGYASRVPGMDPTSWPRTKAVGNKILMVGAFAQGIADDEKTTPYGLMYGVEIHANALNTILMDNFLINIPYWVNVLILFLSIMIIAFFTSRIGPGWSLVLTVFLIFAQFIVISILFEFKNLMIDFSAPGIGSFFIYIAVVLYRVITEESDKKRIKMMFGKYVSPVVVEKMMDKPPELGGEDNDTTIFFSDIRSFTTLSETMSPQELVQLLNEYLTAMTDCVMEYRGTLDKYIGDAIMCFWGAPIPQEDHALLSCKCSLKQLEILNELNSKWPPEKQIHIGIGLNSGVSTVGNMGSEGRMNYTVMGDNVNLASRLEGINKQYYTSIVISESTYNQVKDRGAICRELDDIRVKGKKKPVRIYELVGFEEGLEVN